MARKRRISATQKRLAQLKKDSPFAKTPPVPKGKGRPMGKFGPKTVINHQLNMQRTENRQVEFSIERCIKG